MNVRLGGLPAEAAAAVHVAWKRSITVAAAAQ